MRGRRSAAGMTLIEVLVGLAILAVVSLSLLTMATLSLHLDQMAEERTVATALAAGRLQQVSALPLQAAADFARYKLPEESLVSGPPPSLITGYGAIPGQPAFRRVVEFRYDTPYAGTLTVEARISWKPSGRLEQEQTMVTFLNGVLQ